MFLFLFFENKKFWEGGDLFFGKCVFLLRGGGGQIVFLKDFLCEGGPRKVSSRVSIVVGSISTGAYIISIYRLQHFSLPLLIGKTSILFRIHGLCDHMAVGPVSFGYTSWYCGPRLCLKRKNNGDLGYSRSQKIMCLCGYMAYVIIWLVGLSATWFCENWEVCYNGTEINAK